MADCRQTGARLISPLDPLHPDGVPRRVHCLGGNYPSWLAATPRAPNVGEVDLLVLAPLAAECQSPGWLGAMVTSVTRWLAPDGIVYVHAPARSRVRIRDRLRELGLTIGPFFVHLPSWEACRYLVPLQSGPATYAFTTLLATAAWKRQLILGALRLPRGNQILGSGLPASGFVARRPRGRALFDWLDRLEGDGAGSTSAIVGTSQRCRGGSVVVHRFASGAGPSGIAKLTRGVELTDDAASESAILAHLGPLARAAGARVPEVRAADRLGNHRVFLEGAIAGRPAAVILDGRPDRVRVVMGRVVDWLAAWSAATRSVCPLDHAVLGRDLLTKAEDLAAQLGDGPAYVRWLATRLPALASIPLVATHNDLTMWNVLLDGQLGEEGDVGVVDWQEGRAKGLPLVDFLYAMTDAVRVSRVAPDRLAAFRQCVAPNGAYGGDFRRFLTCFRLMLGLPADAVEVCLHACFLGHAWNEWRQNEHADAREFLAVVRWLVANRDHVQRWVAG